MSVARITMVDYLSEEVGDEVSSAIIQGSGPTLGTKQEDI